jgi:hypothetical protein
MTDSDEESAGFFEGMTILIAWPRNGVAPASTNYDGLRY